MQTLDRFGRPDDGSDGRRHIARGRTLDTRYKSRTLLLTPAGRAMVRAYRVGRVLTVAQATAVEWVAVPVWALDRAP